MVAPGYGYGNVAMAALGYGGPQSFTGPSRAWDRGSKLPWALRRLGGLAVGQKYKVCQNAGRVTT